MLLLRLAGHRGFEPLLPDLESDVLPLTLMTYLKNLSPLIGKPSAAYGLRSRCFGGTPTASYWERGFLAVLFSTGKTENPDPFQELGFSKGAKVQPITHEDYGHP